MDIDVMISKSEHARLTGNSHFKKGNFEECRRHFTYSLELDDENFKTLNNLGVLYEKLGDYQQASSHYKKACSLMHSPSEETAKYFENLGRASEIVGDMSTALWAYERALEVHYANEYSIAVRYLEILTRLQHCNVDKRSVNALEHIATLPNVDLQIVSDEYFKNIQLDKEFSHPSRILDVASVFLKYKLSLTLLSTCLNTNPLIEKTLTLLATELLACESQRLLTKEQSELLKALKAQYNISGGVQIFTTGTKPTYEQPSKLSPVIFCQASLSNKAKNKPAIRRPHKASSLIPRNKLRCFYEANPYPFWKNRPHHIPAKFEDYFSHLGLSLNAIPKYNKRILVAGCGTGRHAIQLALTYPDVQVIGIDISLSSLRYANSQKNLHCVENVKFIHCSIFDVSSLKLKFKIIECIGVLHHLKHQTRAMESLISALDSDGVLKLGLYSKQARSPLIALKSLCKSKGVKYLPVNIQAIRTLLLQSNAPHFWSIINSKDFYSRQGCMDLLFNPYEDPFTIRKIYELTATHNLDFCGFYCDARSEQQPPYKRFGNHQNLKPILSEWHTFEQNNPTAFCGMYLFWVRPRKPHENC